MKRLGLIILIFFLNCTYYSGAAQSISVEQGRDLLKRGSYKEAITVFTALAGKDPSNWQAQEGLPRARMETGDSATAEKQAESFLSSQPDAGPLRLISGDIKLETGRFAEAHSEYERAA